MIRVYQYGLLPPVGPNADLAKQQLRAAHNYRNELVSIERGRRWAIREIHNKSQQVIDAIALVKQATRSTRKAALKTLNEARKAAEQSIRCPPETYDPDKYSFSPLFELERINLLDRTIRRDARAITDSFWGSYLTVEDAHERVRKTPLYEPDGITPNDPKFQRWRGEGQIGIQLQGGMATAALLSNTDTRARVTFHPDRRGRSQQSYDDERAKAGRKLRFLPRYGILSLRVGSDARRPIFAEFPLKLHRPIPDNAKIKWIRVSCRNDGPWKHWTCEITCELPDDNWRERDQTLSGAIAIELMWAPQDDGAMIVATTLDDAGQKNTIALPPRLTQGIRKPDGIRSVRDQLKNHLVEILTRELVESIPHERAPIPRWLLDAKATLHLWKSPGRFYELTRRWRGERYDGLRSAYEILQAWELRDMHLWEYETGARGDALRTRKHLYRNIAAQLSQKYKAVLLPDRDLSREARWGEDSDRRFTVAPQELRDALKHRFGKDAVEVEWRGPHGVIDDESKEDAPLWLEVAIERWRDGKTAEGARKGRKPRKAPAKEGGAWARRKAERTARAKGGETARETAGNDA